MRVDHTAVRLDRETVQYMQQAVEERGSAILRGIPLDPSRAMRLSGDPQISLAIAQTADRRYVVLVPTDVVPRDPNLAALLQDAQVVDDWQVLRLQPAVSVAGALNGAGAAFGWGVVAEEVAAQTPHPRMGRNVTVRVPGAEADPRTPTEQRQPQSLSYTRDLTAAARRGELPPVVGREKELEQVFTILLQKERNCPLLVGDAGVGKTAVVEKLALLSANPVALPSRLQPITVLALDLPSLLGASPHRGDLERHTSEIAAALLANPDLLLFVDEIHNLADARGDISMLEALKPHLARSLRLIGATTHADYKRCLAGDAAATRRFDLVVVTEPTPEETIEILEARLATLEPHHEVSVERALLRDVVRLADEYFPDRRRPDKALMLLDRAMAAQALKGEVVS